jgi:hypothetical protein
MKQLSKEQKDALLTWIAEGLDTDEINKRAAKFKPPFKVSRQLVRHYRKTRELSFQEIKEADENSALKKGFAIRVERVTLLQTMAEKIVEDLFPQDDVGNKRWLEMSKTVANEPYDYVQFNRGEFEELRGILDDIAREVGERRPDMVVNNNFNFSMEEWKKQRSERLKEVESLEAD